MRSAEDSFLKQIQWENVATLGLGAIGMQMPMQALFAQTQEFDKKRQAQSLQYRWFSIVTPTGKTAQHINSGLYDSESEQCKPGMRIIYHSGDQIFGPYSEPQKQQDLGSYQNAKREYTCFADSKDWSIYSTTNENNGYSFLKTMDELPPITTIFVSCKAYDLKNAQTTINELIKKLDDNKQLNVVLLQNGVEPYIQELNLFKGKSICRFDAEVYDFYYKNPRIIPIPVIVNMAAFAGIGLATSEISIARSNDPKKACFTAGTFQEIPNISTKEQALHIQSIIESTGLTCSFTNDLLAEKWNKILTNLIGSVMILAHGMYALGHGEMLTYSDIVNPLESKFSKVKEHQYNYMPVQILEKIYDATVDVARNMGIDQNRFSSSNFEILKGKHSINGAYTPSIYREYFHNKSGDQGLISTEYENFVPSLADIANSLDLGLNILDKLTNLLASVHNRRNLPNSAVGIINEFNSILQSKPFSPPRNRTSSSSNFPLGSSQIIKGQSPICEPVSDQSNSDSDHSASHNLSVDRQDSYSEELSVDDFSDDDGYPSDDEQANIKIVGIEDLQKQYNVSIKISGKRDQENVIVRIRLEPIKTKSSSQMTKDIGTIQSRCKKILNDSSGEKYDYRFHSLIVADIASEQLAKDTIKDYFRSPEELHILSKDHFLLYQALRYQDAKLNDQQRLTLRELRSEFSRVATTDFMTLWKEYSDQLQLPYLSIKLPRSQAEILKSKLESSLGITSSAKSKGSVMVPQPSKMRFNINEKESERLLSLPSHSNESRKRSASDQPKSNAKIDKGTPVPNFNELKTSSAEHFLIVPQNNLSQSVDTSSIEDKRPIPPQVQPINIKHKQKQNTIRCLTLAEDYKLWLELTKLPWSKFVASSRNQTQTTNPINR